MPRSPGTPPRPREVEDEKVGRPCLEERRRHRERLVHGARDEDREPFQAHATGGRLHGIEAPGEIHPGDEGAAGLGLRDRPQGESRRAAGSVAPERDRPGPREAARREQRVELREAGGDAPADIPRRLAGERPGAGAGAGRAPPGRGTRRRPDRAGRPGAPASRPWERGGRPGLRRSGAAASAPKTSTAGRGAAAPQRTRRLARAAARSAWRSIGRPILEHLFYIGKGLADRSTGEPGSSASRAPLSP